MKKFLKKIGIIPTILEENQDENFVDWSEPNSSWCAEQKELYLKVQQSMINGVLFPFLTGAFAIIKFVLNDSFALIQSISWLWIIPLIVFSVIHYSTTTLKDARKYYKYVDEKNGK